MPLETNLKEVLMEIINRKNILPTTCVSYTIISQYIVFSEMNKEGMSSTHFNLIFCLVYTALAVLILSKHHLLDRFSPLVMIIIQFVVANIAIVGITFVTGLFLELHPDAYIDSIRSFSSFYIIGAVVYYISLVLEIRKQNKAIDDIQGTLE